MSVYPPFVGQGFHIAKEASYGTAPAAVSNRLNSLGLTVTPMKEKAPFRASGSRYPTGHQSIDDWSQLTLSGPLSFTDILWPLASWLGDVAPSAAGTGYEYVFASDGVTPLTPLSYTLHYGDGTRARQVSGAVFHSLSFETNREGELTMEAQGFGKQVVTGVTSGSTPPWDTTPTDVPTVPVGPLLFSIWMDDTAWGDLGTTQFLYCLNASFEASERLARIRPVNALLTSDGVAETSDQPISVTFDIIANATGEAMLGDLDADTTIFTRIAAEGAEFDTGENYLLQFDMAIKLSEAAEWQEFQNGVLGLPITGTIVRDITSGNALEVTVKNGEVADIT